jgi:hypothetical protein
MNGNRTKRSPKKAKNGRAAANFRFVPREERQPEPMRKGETVRKLQRPRASMQAGVTGTTMMTIRVRPLPELQIATRNRR